MIINCPSCKTRYLVDPASLGEAGRQVRCVRCSHVWHEDPPADMPKRIDTITPPEASRTQAYSGSNLPALVTRRRRTNRIGWVVVGLIPVIVAAGLALARNDIVGAWPSAARLYDTVGLPIEARDIHGLRISGVVSERLMEGGVPILLVRGAIENTTEQSQAIPGIRAALKDETGKELHHWTFKASSGALDAGQSMTFEDRLASPPDGAAKLSIRFVVGGRG